MNKEIEARFLEIDKQALIDQLRALKAIDKGEVLLSEVIFYDRENTWQDEGRFVRVRSGTGSPIVTYKHHTAQTIDGAHEIEFTIPSVSLARQFLESIGLVAFRHQEKKRHTFELQGVTLDIDTWPNVPAYVELEGPSEAVIQSVAELLGFNWQDACFQDARTIIQAYYNTPVGAMQWFTFDRTE